MAKKSMVEREKKRQKLVDQYATKRAALKEIANDESKPMEERFTARLKPNCRAIPAQCVFTTVAN